jgi:hypothetical protein
MPVADADEAAWTRQYIFKIEDPKSWIQSQSGSTVNGMGS